MQSADDLFKGRHFDREIIVLCVRWYLRYKLSFRDLVEMMAERGLSLAHTTIMRSVQRYVPEFENGGTVSRAKSADRGASMRPTSKSGGAGSISTAPSTRREKQWIFCCARSEMSPPPKRFSVVRSRATDGRRAKSRSPDIRRHFGRRASFSRSIDTAHGLEFDRQNT
jgi:hypothetical protein